MTFGEVRAEPYMYEFEPGGNYTLVGDFTGKVPSGSAYIIGIGLESAQTRFDPIVGLGVIDSKLYDSGLNYTQDMPYDYLPTPDPEKSTTRFVGWHTSTNLVDILTNAAAFKVNEETLASTNVPMLYALWKFDYAVTLHSNCQPATNVTKQLVYNEVGQLPSNSFEQVGFAFQGWATNAHTEVMYADGASVTNLVNRPDEVCDLYAVWKSDHHWIRFDANGGSGYMPDQMAVFDQCTALAENQLARSGSLFAGWATTNVTVVDYLEGAIVSNLSTIADAVVTLKAVWTNDLTSGYVECTNEYSYVSRDLTQPVMVGGTWQTLAFTNTSSAAKTMRVSLDPAANDIARTGTVVQVVWEETNSVTFTDLPTNAVTITFNPNVEYIFQCSNSVDHVLGIGLEGARVSYDANYGTFVKNGGPTNLLLTVDTPYGYAPAVARDAFVFDGWYTAPRGGTLVTSNSLVCAATLYAHWQAKIVPYWVAFDGGEGVDERIMASMHFAAGEVRELATNRHTRVGYEFAGWHDETNHIDYVDGQVVSNLLGIVEATNVLSAIWEPIEYTLAFDNNGGRGAMAMMPVVYDSTNRLPRCEFGRADHRFKGWATNATGEVMYTDEQLITNRIGVVAGGTNVLYAVWENNNNFVVYEVGESNVFDKVDFNTGKPVVFDGTILKSQLQTFYVAATTNGTYRLSVDPITGMRKGTTVEVATQATNGEWQVKTSVSDMSAKEVLVTFEQGVTNKFTVTASEYSDYLVGVGLPGQTVSFRTNGGEVKAADAAKGLTFNWSEGFVYGFMPELESDPTNMTFLGWFDDPINYHTEYVKTDLVTDGLGKLYAGWKCITNRHLVCFVDCRSGIETNCLAEGSFLRVLPELTSTDEATFVGWSTNDFCGSFDWKSTNYAKVPLMVTNNWTFYAQWSTNLILEANDKGNWTVVRYVGEVPQDLDIPGTIGTGSVVGIGSNVFANAAIVSVTLPGSLTSIATNAFAGCTCIDSASLPLIAPLSKIFPDCYRTIAEVTLAADADCICDEAFKDCAGIKELEIPRGVTSVGDAAFAECTNLCSVSFPTLFPDDEAERDDGFLSEDNAITIGEGAFSGCVRLTEIELPLGVCILPARIFEGCTSLNGSGFEMPYTVKEIGEYAFSNCTAMTGITVTEHVDTIGDHAFHGCSNLKIVRYLGEPPSSVGENMYYHTRNDLVSGWNSRLGSTSWSEVGDTPWKTSKRTVAQWDASNMYSFYKVTFNYNNGNNQISEVLYIKGRVLGSLKADPENGYGWWTRAIGGKRYRQYKVIDEAVKLYAHWSVSDGGGGDDGDSEDGTEDGDDEGSGGSTTEQSGQDTPSGGSDVGWNEKFYSGTENGFAFSAAVFNGYVLAGEAIVGTFKLTTSAGKKVKIDDGSYVTNSKFKVTFTLLGKSKKTLSGTIDENGVAYVESGNYTFEATLSQFGIEGALDDTSDDGGSYTLQGARDRYSAGSDAAKYAVRMALAAARGSWNVVLKSSVSEDLGGGQFVHECYNGLTVTIGNKGAAKITGIMADGTKVSATSTLVVGDGCCCLPVMVPLYSGKKGGFAFCMWFSWQDDMSFDDDDYSIQGLSQWDASMNKKAAFVAGLEVVQFSYMSPVSDNRTLAFNLEGTLEIEGVTIADELLPTDTEITMNGTRWTLPKADKIKFDRESESWVDQSEDPVNPAGLKLSYKATSGQFSGSFTVYGVTDAGKSKKYTAKVNGVFLPEHGGYGTATIQKVGSFPVTIPLE